MGMLRHMMFAALLAAELAGCSSEAASPEPIRSPSLMTTPPASPVHTVPAMPGEAKTHTPAGAKAFVIYYVKVIDYAQLTLNTSLLEKLSSPSCSGCQSGISSLKSLAQKHGYFTSSSQTVSTLVASPIASGKVAHLTFDVTAAPQHQVIPGVSNTKIPGGKTHEFISLLPQEEGWLVGELGENR